MGLVSAVVFIAVLLGAAAYFRMQQRVRSIKLFASLNKLVLMGSDWDLGDCGFGLFNEGNRRYWRNIMRGPWSGLPVTYCDFTYVVNEGRSENTFSFSNVIGVLGMPIPSVTVSPRGVIGAFAERTVGAPGIRFESIEFNDRFDVHSDDESFAVELIDAQMIETLLSLDHGYHVAFGPEYLMVYARRRPVEELRGLFDATVLVSRRIPNMVRERFNLQQPAPEETSPQQPTAPPG
jgi:Protein of unknown function (DUF3137)